MMIYCSFYDWLQLRMNSECGHWVQIMGNPVWYNGSLWNTRSVIPNPILRTQCPIVMTAGLFSYFLPGRTRDQIEQEEQDLISWSHVSRSEANCQM
jgi:hypothetical protein